MELLEILKNQAQKYKRKNLPLLWPYHYNGCEISYSKLYCTQSHLSYRISLYGHTHTHTFDNQRSNNTQSNRQIFSNIFDILHQRGGNWWLSKIVHALSHLCKILQFEYNQFEYIGYSKSVETSMYLNIFNYCLYNTESSIHLKCCLLQHFLFMRQKKDVGYQSFLCK